jgi:DNA-binding beta-propeller fold protein YncE
VASPDGRWLLTLYLSTRRDVAFIHALNLIDKYPLCIDLPSGSGNFSQLKDYTLALSPSGRTVYAANAALGVVAEVSLDQWQVVRQAKFAAGTFEAAAHDMHSPTAHGVISGDGQMLYFANGKEVWSYGTQTGKVSGPYLMDGHIRGLGLSGDGQRLYVAGLDRSLRVFDTTTGAALSFQGAVDRANSETRVQPRVRTPH